MNPRQRPRSSSSGVYSSGLEYASAAASARSQIKSGLTRYSLPTERLVFRFVVFEDHDRTRHEFVGLEADEPDVGHEEEGHHDGESGLRDELRQRVHPP